ncbi:MAG TPA: hypothetical protein VFB23_02640 [Candidatus Acidoferrales bacterium]|nr:hypothetical protein [Candidatus Acidoferrales bacterium]
MKIRLCLLAGVALLCSSLVSPASAQSFKPGTPIQIQLLTPLNTGSAQPGQEFSATLAQPVSDGQKLWPRGTQVKGKVLEVVSSGRLSRPASITLQITEIGTSRVTTEPEQIDGRSHAGRNAGLILGGAAAGAILGSIAGGGKGAIIGTAAGAGAGTITAAATGKKEINLRSETTLNFAVAGAAAAVAPPPPPPAPSVAPPPQPEYRESAERVDAPPAPAEVREREGDYPEPGYEERDRGFDERRDSDRPHRFRVFFNDRDERIIREYFRTEDYGRGLPPELRHERDRDLPPGLERRLHRDGNLPEGLEHRVHPFPEDLERRMESLPRGYWRGILAGRAMILRDDGDIVDMMYVY